MTEVLALVVLIAALAYSGYVLGLRFRAQGGVGTELAERVAERVKVPVREAFGPPRVMRTVYLNREGARLHGGPDDSQSNRSSIVAQAGIEYADIPPFAGTPSRFVAILKCVREAFAPFDVEVVDQRPVDRDYIMAMMGGKADVLGEFGRKSHHPLGLSPYNGKPIEDAVVLVFTRTMREQTRKVCETAGMEIGHAFGLDHARHCRDLMTYMRPCGKKRFVDEALPCGEHEARSCGDGSQNQNSFAMLRTLLGARPQAAAQRASGQ
ncbi:MAG: hypothetical protein OEZ06_27175 [Myxococcales bacterium]|nr:hypothetical protein [Myxococcales bacterium]